MIYTIGRVDAPVLVILTQPTYSDIKAQELASGPEREAIFSILESQGIMRKDVCITCLYNTTNKVTSSTRNADHYAETWLSPFIKSHKRRLLVPMGNDATYAVGLLNALTGVNSVRGTLCYSDEYPDVPIFPSQNIYFVMKEPDEADDVSLDIRNAVNMLRGKDMSLPKLEIRDLETPADVEALFMEATEQGRCAYDFETDTGEKHIALAVTGAYYTGKKNADGVPIVYFWGGYDCLVPRFSEDRMAAMNKAFKVFFTNAHKRFKLLAWNMGFDDAVAMHNYLDDKPFVGSSTDGMLREWGVDNRSYNGLKEATFRRLGYPNYDDKIEEHVKAITARRGRNLVNPDDFRVLERFGVEPDKQILASGKEKITWPKTLDKKTAAWALVPYDDLRLYNAYDAYFTLEVIDVLEPLVEKYGLEKSQELRHRIARMFMHSELRGFQCDVEANRRISGELAEIIASTTKLCESEMAKLFPDPKDNVWSDMKVAEGKFVLNSGDNVARLLFGRPTQMPSIVPVNDNASKKNKAIIADFNREFYSETEKVRELIDAGSINISAIDARIRQVFKQIHGDMKVEITTTLQDHYFHGLYIPKMYTDKGKVATTATVLNNLYQEKPLDILKYLLMYRRAYKLKSTFVDSIYNKLDKDGILRYRLNAIGTNTGRVSSSRPNCQNFVKYIRGQMIPRKGYEFVEFDLSQAEIRAIAAFSGDERLIAALNEKDMHRYIASLIFKKPAEEVTSFERTASKKIIFGILYGLSYVSLAVAINCTEEEAQKFIEDFYMAFPDVKVWLDQQIANAKEAPYKARTPWGTMRSTKNIFSIDRKEVKHMENVSQNMPIQGAAGELTLYYICEIMDEVNRLGLDVHMINTTHDSCTLEVPLGMSAQIIELVERVIATPAPVEPLNRVTFKADIEVTQHWACPPDVRRAIDPNYDTDASTFPWDIILNDEEALV